MSTATKQAKRAALVIAPQWVGDAILSLPLIDQLRQEYDSVDVLAVPAVAAVYRCSPAVRKIHEAAFIHGRLQWGLRREIARQMRDQYASAIVLPNSLKSALIPWLAGIKVRRGMTGESRYLLINERRSPPTTANGQPDGSPDAHRPSMLHHYLQLADHPIPIDQVDGFGQHRPRMQLPEGLEITPPKGRLLMLCPGAEYGPAKQWPIEKFADTAAAWIQRGPDHRVVVLGSPKEQPLGDALVAIVSKGLSATERPEKSRQLENLIGKTSLLQAFAWIAQAELVVSNDSGLMHAAAALDVPVVAIFGSTDPHHTPPHSEQASIVSLNLPCSPCFKRVCPLGTTACLRDIDPQAVIRFFPPA